MDLAYFLYCKKIFNVKIPIISLCVEWGEEGRGKEREGRGRKERKGSQRGSGREEGREGIERVREEEREGGREREAER